MEISHIDCIEGFIKSKNYVLFINVDSVDKLISISKQNKKLNKNIYVEKDTIYRPIQIYINKDTKFLKMDYADKTIIDTMTIKDLT